MTGVRTAVSFLTVLAVCLLAGAQMNDPVDVTLDIDPTTVVEGLTSLLTVNCSLFTDSNDPNITLTNSTLTQPFTLMLKYIDGKDVEVATISSLNDPNTPIVTAKGKQLNATAEGYLGRDGLDSYLTVRFGYPTKQLAKEFVCVLTGMDDTFHVMSLQDSSTLNVTGVQLQDAVKEIQTHEERLSRLEGKMDSLFSRFDSFKAAVTSFEFSIGGRGYLVSRPIMQNAALAEAVCQLLGGYLLEVDDQAEFDDVSELLINNTVPLDVMVGDNQEDGSWKFREHPGRPRFLVYNGPANQDANCGLLVSEDWHFTAQECYKNDVNVQFVCENV